MKSRIPKKAAVAVISAMGVITVALAGHAAGITGISFEQRNTYVVLVDGEIIGNFQELEAASDAASQAKLANPDAYVGYIDTEFHEAQLDAVPPTTAPKTTAPNTTAPKTTASTTTEPPSTVAPTTAPPTDAGLASIDDFSYQGAFRVSAEEFGDSSANWAVGALAYNEVNRSLFLAGHDHHDAIGEFAIPAELGTATSVIDLPEVEPIQPFTTWLDRVKNPDEIDVIAGMYVHDGSLIVNAEKFYDAAGMAKDTSVVISDANNLDSAVTGFYQMEGGAKAAGYMSPVPAEWQDTIGSSVLTGWASNYSIISRYSIGPSIYGVDPDDFINNNAGPIHTDPKMVFPFDSQIVEDAWDNNPDGADPLWNSLTRGIYGFIIPGTRTFAVIGSSGGIDSGIGYKNTQDDGFTCPGPCPYAVADRYNYYWLFDLDDLNPEDPSTPRPYDYGKLSVPFDEGHEHLISGAAFDPDTSTLYVSLNGAGQVGTYDRTPLILGYEIG